MYVWPGSVSLVTTAPAPTIEFTSIVIPHIIVAPVPIEAPRRIKVRSRFQSSGPFTMPLVILGLFILAIEFAWAESLLTRAKNHAKKLDPRKMKKPKPEDS